MRTFGSSALGLWIAAPFLLWLTLYRPFGTASDRARGLPAQVGGFHLVKEHPLTERTMALLGTRDAISRTYGDSAGHEIYLVAVFHAENWKSVHPPRICIEGSNMTVSEEREVADDLGVAGAGRYALLRAVSKDNGQGFVSCYVYGTADVTTASYSSFFLHHVPRALLRRSTSGFLLRVESWEDGDGAQARARCVEFLKAVLPSARELVR